MSLAIEKSSLANRIAADTDVRDLVVARLTDGETPLAVAEFLQNELLEFTEAKPDELAHALQQVFVTEVPLHDRLDLLKTGRSAIAQTVAKQRKRETTLERLNRLLDLQMGRIDAIHAQELTDEKAKGMTANEIEIARRLARDIHTVEQDTGGMASAPSSGVGQGQLSDGIRQKLGKVLKSLIDEADGPRRVKAEPLEEEAPTDVEFQTVDDEEHADDE